jgi:uncharacterized protein YbjT (DUF2867 family)
MRDGSEELILVTGPTGYVGGRLAPRLLAEGYRVRVMVRGRADRLRGRYWREDAEVVAGDVLRPDDLAAAMDGVTVAYYLIHSMRGSGLFSQRDVRAAQNFASAAAATGVRRIIYLGGLGDPQANPSEHLRSRQEAGAALRQAGVPVTEFRAGMIVGSGSLAFEMIRDLTERLPVMVCPRWVYSRTQPVAMGDVLAYLVAALQTGASINQIVEIGGPDILTYEGMMRTYARMRGLRRLIIPAPVLTPRLSSFWVHWITPVPADIARPLIEGLRYDLVVRDDLAQRLFPEIQPISYEAAVKLALKRTEEGRIETIWSDAIASSRGDRGPVLMAHEQGMLIERRRQLVAASPKSVFQAFSGIGGERGWPAYSILWRLRGALDRLVGGVGMRRGRRDPDQIRQGDALDFWRVEAVETNRLLRLRAEMKLPGEAWLQFEARPADGDVGKKPPADDGRRNTSRTELIQTAYFASRGLFGQIYWYGLYPLHGLIFGKMVRNLGRRAEQLEALAK